MCSLAPWLRSSTVREFVLLLEFVLLHEVRGQSAPWFQSSTVREFVLLLECVLLHEVRGQSSAPSYKFLNVSALAHFLFKLTMKRTFFFFFTWLQILEPSTLAHLLFKVTI
jgi:hypothetical protein